MLPFRGGTISVWSDTHPGRLAIIAQLALADPRYDAFYRAAGVELKDTAGKVVFPPPKRRSNPARAPEPDPIAEDTKPDFFNDFFTAEGG